MEHPSVNVPEIKENMNLEEIHEKITDLTKRLSFAYNMGNQPMINQLQMILECYTRAQKEILDEMFGGGDKDDGDPRETKIDIS